jgi:hypothetical protein
MWEVHYLYPRWRQIPSLLFGKPHTTLTILNRKNVIFTDETSVVPGRRRGRVRVWRIKDERVEASVIRPTWKGASAFMFWGSFSYEKKGPYHTWKTETAAEQKAAKKDLQTLNDSMEKEAREKWQLTTGMRRLVLRHGRAPGRVPEWKFNQALIRKLPSMEKASNKALLDQL